MESKLPKPTSLRKPTPRTEIPSNRILSVQQSTNGLSIQNTTTTQLVSTATATTMATKSFITNSRSVLTQNFENVCNMLNGKRPTKRHASPELHKAVNRPKLRRSRSVSDLAPSAAAFSRDILKQAFKRPANAISRDETQKFRKPIMPAVKTTKPNNAVLAKKPIFGSSSSTTSASAITKGNAKVAIKRIPAYDFKSRYNDLMEKHKVLKDKYERACEKLKEYDSLPEQYEECQNTLHKIENELKNVNIELECLRRQTNADKTKIESISSDLSKMTIAFQTEKEEKGRLSKQNNEIKCAHDKLQTENDELKVHNAQLAIDLQEARQQMFQFNIERKEMHNTIMDLRGSIRVFCRVRPPLENESNRALCLWQYQDESTLEIASVDNARKQIKHDFTFDQVFPPMANQRDIFELVSPLIQSALDGYNVAIFAYGQTGSGKTYTMDGDSSNYGIIPHTIDFLFECFNQYRKLGWEYKLSVASLEIYNEMLFDLFTNENKEMEIRMANAKARTEVYVSNLTEVDIQCKEELHELLRLAKGNRATAATAGNERSSRSHAVTQLRLIGQHEEKNEVNMGMINLIDLAGSESPKTSVRMDETKKINKSLSELTNVIMALLQKQDHIPYRNSKLTHLLMPSLGGNSKTLMFVNVSPFQDCFIETVKSLRFAASVNACKLAKAKKNKFYANSYLNPSAPNASASNSNSSINSSMS